MKPLHNLSSLFLKCLLLILLHSPRSTLASFRVINGDIIPITQAPYIAALIETPDRGHMCGGTIIAHRVVATAAHCLEGVVNYVRVGSASDREGGQLIKVLKYVSHSLYSSRHEVDAVYDYGVVILAQRIVFGGTVAQAVLARKPLPEGKILTLSGWGDGRVLKQTRIPIYNQTECMANYGYIPIELNPRVEFCAGFKHANSTSCFGDSGGPLMNGKRELYGIVSWGDNDCQVQDYPGVYARVETMAEWFQAFMDEYK